MAEHINVFISSTSRDLSEYRDAVTEVVLRLGLHPIIMETFNPTDNNALQLCYDKVQEAEIFVGIYAHRYGYAPPAEVAYQLSDGSERTGDGKTGITHLEYLWALERNLPILLFVISDKDSSGAPLAWSVEYIEQGDGASSLQTFKQLIMSKHVVGFFHSPDNLASKVATGLAQVKADVRTSSVPRRDYYEHVAMPKNYIVREELQENLVSKVVRGNPVVALTGIGGIGKSVMARSLCEEEGIQSAFPNGILWATLGQTPDIAQELRRWVDRLGGTVSETSPSIEDLRQALNAVAKDRSYLFIVDDVWDIEHIQSFVIESPNSTLLFTTRSRDIANHMNASSEGIPVMKRDEAVSLLEEWAEGKLAYTDDSLKTEIVEKVLKLALTVRIAGAQLKRKEPEKWLEEFNPEAFGPSRSTLREHGPLEEIFRQALADLQEPEDAHLYTALAIFKEDELVPEVAIRKLWQELEGLSDYEAADLIEDLAQFGLLEVTGEGVDLHVRLHDLLREFISNRLTDEQKQGLHETLLTAYRQTQTGDGWHTAPDDGYIYDHLVYHLQETDNYEAARTLFMSDDWMRVRVEANHKRYDTFVSDLMIVWQQMVHARFEQAIEADASDLSVFSDICRYAIIRSTINTMAGSYILPIVEKALELGYWEVDQALDIISYIPDVENKFKSHVLLLQHLDNNSDEFLQVLDIVNEIVLQLPFTGSRREFRYGSGLTHVTDLLTDEMIAEHVEHILKLASDNRFDYHFYDIASRLNEQQVDLFLDRFQKIGFDDNDILAVYEDLVINASTEQHHIMFEFAKSSLEDIQRILLIGHIAVAQTGDFQKQLIHIFYEQISNQESLKWHHVKPLDTISTQLADVIPNSNSSVARFQALRWAVIAYDTREHDWQTALPALLDTYSREDLHKEFDEWEDRLPEQAIILCYPYMTAEQKMIALQSKSKIGCSMHEIMPMFKDLGKSQDRMQWLLRSLLGESHYSSSLANFLKSWRENGYQEDEVRVIAKHRIEFELKQPQNSTTKLSEQVDRLEVIAPYLSTDDIDRVAQLEPFYVDYKVRQIRVIAPYMSESTINEVFDKALEKEYTIVITGIFTVLAPYLDHYQIDSAINILKDLDDPRDRNDRRSAIRGLIPYANSDQQHRLFSIVVEKNITLDIDEEWLNKLQIIHEELFNHIRQHKDNVKILGWLASKLSPSKVQQLIDGIREDDGIKEREFVRENNVHILAIIKDKADKQQVTELTDLMMEIISQEELSYSRSKDEVNLLKCFDAQQLEKYVSLIVENVLKQEEKYDHFSGWWKFPSLKTVLPYVQNTSYLEPVLDAVFDNEHNVWWNVDDVLQYFPKSYINKTYEAFIARLEELHLTYDQDENDTIDTIRSMSSNEVAMGLLEYLDESQVLQLLDLSLFKENDWMPCAEQYIKYVTVNTLDAVFDKFAVPNSYYSDEDSLGLLAQRASQDPALYTQFANAVFKDWYSNRDERQIYAEYVNKRFLNAIFSGNWFNQFAEEDDMAFLQDWINHSSIAFNIDISKHIASPWYQSRLQLELARSANDINKEKIVTDVLNRLHHQSDERDQTTHLMFYGDLVRLIRCSNSKHASDILDITNQELDNHIKDNQLPGWDVPIFEFLPQFIHMFFQDDEDHMLNKIMVCFENSKDSDFERSRHLIHFIKGLNAKLLSKYQTFIETTIDSLAFDGEKGFAWTAYYQALSDNAQKTQLKDRVLNQINSIQDTDQRMKSSMEILPMLSEHDAITTIEHALDKLEQDSTVTLWLTSTQLKILNMTLPELIQERLLSIANAYSNEDDFLIKYRGMSIEDSNEYNRLTNIKMIYSLLSKPQQIAIEQEYLQRVSSLMRNWQGKDRKYVLSTLLLNTMNIDVMTKSMITHITDAVINIIWEWEWGKV